VIHDCSTPFHRVDAQPARRMSVQTLRRRRHVDLCRTDGMLCRL
jgi:hypothetical protein